MGITASTAMIIGTVVSAVAAAGSMVMGSMQASAQARQSRDAASYAQAMAMRNRQLAEIQAQKEEEAGAYQAGLIRDKARKLLGRQKSMYGKAGVETFGSPLELMAESQEEAAADADMTLYNAHYNAWRARTAGETSLLEGNYAASRYTAEANSLDSASRWNMIAAPIAAGSSILTGYNRYRWSKGGTADPDVAAYAQLDY